MTRCQSIIIGLNQKPKPNINKSAARIIKKNTPSAFKNEWSNEVKRIKRPATKQAIIPIIINIILSEGSEEPSLIKLA